jgi:hypothetical protein
MYSVTLTADRQFSGSGNTVDGAVESLLRSVCFRYDTDEAQIAFNVHGDEIVAEIIDDQFRYFDIEGRGVIDKWPFHYPIVDDPPMVMTFDVILVLPGMEYTGTIRLYRTGS